VRALSAGHPEHARRFLFAPGACATLLVCILHTSAAASVLFRVLYNDANSWHAICVSAYYAAHSVTLLVGLCAPGLSVSSASADEHALAMMLREALLTNFGDHALGSILASLQGAVASDGLFLCSSRFQNAYKKSPWCSYERDARAAVTQSVAAL
jgi:hypothetical protein